MKKGLSLKIKYAIMHNEHDRIKTLKTGIVNNKLKTN